MDFPNCKAPCSTPAAPAAKPRRAAAPAAAKHDPTWLRGNTIAEDSIFKVECSKSKFRNRSFRTVIFRIIRFPKVKLTIPGVHDVVSVRKSGPKRRTVADLSARTKLTSSHTPTFAPFARSK